jgi:hypothetical protein
LLGTERRREKNRVKRARMRDGEKKNRIWAARMRDHVNISRATVR